jgi:hypothetical protein
MSSLFVAEGRGTHQAENLGIYRSDQHELSRTLTIGQKNESSILAFYFEFLTIFHVTEIARSPTLRLRNAMKSTIIY